MTPQQIRHSINRKEVEIERLKYQLDFGSADGFVPSIIPKLMDETCRAFQIEETALLSSSRRSYLVTARATLATVAYKKGVTLEAIAEHLNRDHSSVINLVHDFDNRMKNFPELGEKMRMVVNFFN